MKLVNSKELVDDAFKKGYAVPGFNAGHMEFIKAIIDVADEMRSPVIIQVGHTEIDYAGGKNIVDMVKNFGEDKNIKAAIHLDHGPDMRIVLECIRNGFSSVMYDGSMLPFEENISKTKEIVDVSDKLDISVEGELGSIGGTSEWGEKIHDDYQTDPVLAGEYVKKTGVNSLAIGIGNVHGLYKGTPKLDFELLKNIAENTNIPLVLHGGSGIPEADIKKAISMGISKINVSSQLRKAFITGMKEYMEENPKGNMTINIMERGYEKVKDEIRSIIKIFGCENRI
ncbi:class II fructose-bisphosphate aldolase [uncultured Ilyobacter sp.]|uniref:class II fructose-bisphosphate aldolase n=1 Tax=uncultured Ilyobacter sp. TaxID=544433 RepID=UPI0029C95439|nr:class II fructose-bisphosphate aldolase [uncultured Ilyobacter sp.]